MKAVKRKYTLKVEIKIYHICFIDVSVEKMFFFIKRSNAVKIIEPTVIAILD